MYEKFGSNKCLQITKSFKQEKIEEIKEATTMDTHIRVAYN